MNDAAFTAIDRFRLDGRRAVVTGAVRAAAVLFLASDAASFMTGSVVTVDGGYTCW